MFKPLNKSNNISFFGLNNFHLQDRHKVRLWQKQLADTSPLLSMASEGFAGGWGWGAGLAGDRSLEAVPSQAPSQLQMSSPGVGNMAKSCLC